VRRDWRPGSVRQSGRSASGLEKLAAGGNFERSQKVREEIKEICYLPKEEVGRIKNSRDIARQEHDCVVASKRRCNDCAMKYQTFPGLRLH